MNKPIPVKIVEVLGWVYVALAVLLIFLLVISAVVAVDHDGGIWPLVLCGSFPLLLVAPIVLLWCPSASRWFNEMSGDDSPRPAAAIERSR